MKPVTDIFPPPPPTYKFNGTVCNCYQIFIKLFRLWIFFKREVSIQGFL